MDILRLGSFIAQSLFQMSFKPLNLFYCNFGFLKNQIIFQKDISKPTPNLELPTVCP